MGIFHELLVAIGVLLLITITCSISVLGHEYARTGHISLAITDQLRNAEAAPHPHYRPAGR